MHCTGYVKIYKDFGINQKVFRTDKDNFIHFKASRILCSGCITSQKILA